MTHPHLDMVSTGGPVAVRHCPEAERAAPGCAAKPCDALAAEPVLPSRDMIEGAVAYVFGVQAPALKGFSRGKAEVAKARQVAMYLAHTVFGLTLSETGELFGRDRTTVAHACSLVEDQRDDPLFDRVIELLEGVVEALVTPRAMPAALQN